MVDEPTLPNKPSIAVLPFANMSGDPEQEYFADGIVEEITTALSKIRWFFVIARNSSFTYKGRAVDLRQVRDVERMAVVAFAESRSPLTWGGTLVVTTFAGARVELPLEALYPGTAAVLLSLYNVDGELVIRAEMETIDGDLRQAARAYGYDRITWRDDRTPAD